jgi:prolyl-tRNA editing enzyme YbaK/EbsC (Cys-tRNA(Pro) deacylase)
VSRHDVTGRDAVERALEAAGSPREIRTFDTPVPSAAAAAEQLGCEVGAIANSLVFTAGEEARAVLVLASGAHRVDTAKVAALLELGRVTMADPDMVRTTTGFVIGGVAPVGSLTRLRTLVDVSLSRYDTIWAAAGHPRAVFATTYDEILRVTGAQAIETT